LKTEHEVKLDRTPVSICGSKLKVRKERADVGELLRPEPIGLVVQKCTID